MPKDGPKGPPTRAGDHVAGSISMVWLVLGLRGKRLHSVLFVPTWFVSGTFVVASLLPLLPLAINLRQSHGI